MALSLSPHQPESAVHSQTPHSTASLSYSTPRRFSVSAIENGTSQEILPGMSKGQMAPVLLLPSNFEHASYHDGGMVMHRVAPPSQVIPDLPSWTPLRMSEDDEGLPASEADESSTVVSRSKTTRARTTSKCPDSSGLGAPVNSTSLPSPPKQDAKQRARFAGVVIVSKRRRATRALQSRPAPRREAVSESTTLSLVDALKRTFNANKHIEVSPPPSLPRRLGRLRTAQEQGKDASITPGPQTDIEAGSTEPEDELLQLNNRLLAPRTPKKHLTRAARAIALSESNNDSEDATSVSRDTSVRPERPAKRLKTIAYDAYAALVDATLGTVQAPITWDAQPDFITNDAPITRRPQPPERTSTDVPMDVDGEAHAANPRRQRFTAPPGVAGNPWRTPALRMPPKAVLSPHIPRGDKFKERLVAMFGENATVRTDKTARPKPAAIDITASLDELDREPSPNPSESSASESPASTAEECIRTIPSTQFTSQSPELPPTASPSTSHATSENHRLNEDGLAIGKATNTTFETSEEQMSGWIAALQRLVKGKVRVFDEDLEMLSVVLAEIESMKDSLDARGPMTMELRESLKQLSELQEIPFGDRNNLRRRAGRILLGWPSSA